MGRARNWKWLEHALLLLFGVAATVYAEHRLLFRHHVYQADQHIHEFWMRRFEDPALFQDALTRALLESDYIPDGVTGFYRVASLVVDPVEFAQWLPVVVAPLSAWLVFLITRHRVKWWPAAWIAAGLFLALVGTHRMSGGHARAFFHPIVLLTVYLMMLRRDRPASLVPAVGVFFYPPAALTSLSVVYISSVVWTWPPRPDGRRVVAATVATVLFVLAVLVPRAISDSSAQLITKEEALKYEEFGPRGQMNYFKPDLKEYLKGNYSGFKLESSGSVLVGTAMLLLLLRPRNVLELGRETWAMGVSGLILFGLAQATLFLLYLPQRYTNALLPTLCVFVAASLRPTWEMLARGLRSPVPAWLLAVVAPALGALVGFLILPLGPEATFDRLTSVLAKRAWALWLPGVVFVVAALVAVFKKMWVLPAAVTSGVIVVALVGGVGGLTSGGVSACNKMGLYDALQSLPKDSVIAGHPRKVKCIPIAARRPVLISRKLYQPFEREYFHFIRPRMRALVDAYYGSSVAQVLRLRNEYGVDYLLVHRSLAKDGRKWEQMAPFTEQVQALVNDGEDPAVLSLPDACIVWASGGAQLFDMACIAKRSLSSV